jgi:NRPS condensation-like uncharacterized protein
VAVCGSVAATRSKARRIGIVFTINLRKYIENHGPIIANLSSVIFIIIARSTASRFENLFPIITGLTGERKRRLPGIAFILAIELIIAWVPKSLLRLSTIVYFTFENFQFGFRRLSIITNVGSIDSYLAPFGNDAEDAWMLGPFQRNISTPVAIATGFRDSLTVNICSTDDISGDSVSGLAHDWQKQLTGF